MIRRTIAVIAASLPLVAVTTGYASASTAATALSSNWAGYAVTGTAFKSVSGSWTEPSPRCSSATALTTASAFWVGLGGNSESSTALEQTGTEADCLADGTARYTAWYELVPAAAVRVPLTVKAGDRVTASVRVSGTAVTLELRNLTTGKSYEKTLKLAAPDVSSAEWIAEAPSLETGRGSQVVPLTDFGTVRFTSARATSASGHTGTISDTAWTATRVNLASEAGGGPDPYGRVYGNVSGSTEAVASSLATAGGSFAVTWRRTALASGPAPSGGPGGPYSL